MNRAQVLNASLAVIAFGPAPGAHAADPVEFNADFLQGSGGRVDLAKFAAGNTVLAGDYLVDLDVNGEWLARTKVRFVARGGESGAEPCIDRALLSHLGLAAPHVPAEANDELARGGCLAIARLARGASAEFDQSALHLSLSVPQALLDRRPRGYVAPESWDKGVTSATLAYDASLFRARSEDATTTSLYASLTAGLNLGSWHFRQRSSLTGSNGSWRYQNVAAYVQHDVPRLKASLTLGDAFTDGAVFDSFGFRGVSLASDDRMRPDSQQGYAPVVRGIARTNARVRITQNGNLLLETTVAPGPFEISDLYPTGYGGDLLVTVIEADGRQESFTVTYAALVQLLRPGTTRFSLAAGELDLDGRGGSGSGNWFVQGAVQQGLSNGLTAYAGAAAAPGYVSALAGVALNTPLGAVAVDATLAQARIVPEDPDQGYSVRLSYSKVVPGLLTSVSVAAYRHSSSGFWSMRDAMEAREAVRLGLDPQAVRRQRNRFQVNVTQSLGPGWGNLYLSGSATDYWNRASSVLQLQAGYGNVAHLGKYDLNYGLSYARQRDQATGRTNDRMLLTLSAALGERTNAPQLAMNLAHDRADGGGRTSGRVALSGTVGARSEYSYNANATFAPEGNSFGLATAYRADFATFSASGSAGSRFSQFSLGASGGVVIHPGGVTLANQLGDTIGVVSARDAEGARVASDLGGRVNGAGFAVVPHLMPYRLNEVTIDPQGSSADVELKATRQQVAPRANSVVLVKFDTASGQGVTINASFPDGAPVPFGASVRDARRAEIGIAGQGGQIFLRGLNRTGTLQVDWGEGGCYMDYRLPAAKEGAAMLNVDAVCVPGQPGVLAQQSAPRIEVLPL
jgi:outer membrane usher protein